MSAAHPSNRLAVAVAVLLLAPAAGSAWAASAPIYKCLDRNLGINYTDIPCKDGERLDLRVGNADPAAIARLERERAAWDQSGAQRLAEERRAYLQRRTYDQPAYVVQGGGGFGYADAPDYADYAPYGYGYPFAYGYSPYGYDGSAGNDRRRHGDGRSDRGRGRERQRVVPTFPQKPHR